jgi:crotonobetainyl-CoA:carnitine CoA-transferase CaiB-like acyl-CoA transferase
MSKILEGIRILDLGRFVSAPFGAQFLADWGAEVIKVEKPGGEPGRLLVTKNGVSLYVPTFNRNKKGVTLETRSEEGKELLRKLIAKSDVLIENFVPGTMARMGLSFEEIQKINPRMIVASVSGYGQKGPLASRPVFDPVAQATSGLMSVTGTVESGPLVAGTVIIDHTAGVMMALGILLALYDREHTGKGQYIDIALVDCAIPFLQTYIPNYSANGVVAGLHGNKDLLSCPADTYRCADGTYVYMHAGTQGLYARLLELINDDRLRDERFATVDGRNANQPELEEIVKEWFLTVTGEEAEAKLAEASVIGVVVSDIPQLFKSEQGKLRQQLVDMDVPGVGRVTFPGNPVKMSADTVEYRRAPTVGEHNAEVYGKLLGVSESELERLSKIGAI